MVYDLPEFMNEPKPLKMRINEVKEHNLGIKENPLYKIEAIHEVLPKFTTFVFPNYTMSPKLKSDLGKFKFKGKIGNEKFNVFKAFEFDVEVINDPPEFIGVQKELPAISVIQK